MAEHRITWTIVHAGHVKLSVAKCICGNFVSSGKRLSVADRRKSERLFEAHRQTAVASLASGEQRLEARP